MKSIRFKKRLITVVYHCIILVAAMIGANHKIDWLVYLGVVDLLTFKLIPITKFIQSKLMTTAYCHSCQKSTNLVDYWQCSCGYTSQVPKHLFFPCAQCGNVFTYINCDCGIGILV